MTSSGDRSRRPAEAERATLRLGCEARTGAPEGIETSVGRAPLTVHRSRRPEQSGPGSAMSRVQSVVARQFGAPGEILVKETARARPGLRLEGGGGGVEGDRTPDLRTASAALSQLSYDPG